MRSNSPSSWGMASRKVRENRTHSPSPSAAGVRSPQRPAQRPPACRGESLAERYPPRRHLRWRRVGSRRPEEAKRPYPLLSNRTARVPLGISPATAPRGSSHGAWRRRVPRVAVPHAPNSCTDTACDSTHAGVQRLPERLGSCATCSPAKAVRRSRWRRSASERLV